jgi:hypothetical protein
MYKLMSHFPWFFPATMAAYNIVMVVYGVMVESRVKCTCLQYSFWYASTIPAAVRGDMTPFFTVLSS